MCLLDGRMISNVFTPVPVMALRISVAAASLISREACSLYQAVCGVQIRLGASFSGPWAKLQHRHTQGKKKSKQKTNEWEFLKCRSIKMCFGYWCFICVWHPLCGMIDDFDDRRLFSHPSAEGGVLNYVHLKSEFNTRMYEQDFVTSQKVLKHIVVQDWNEK